MRVLIVEDEKYLSDAVAHILKKNGYDVDQAFDGEDGLEKAKTGIYDVVVLDVMLPKMDGVEVIKCLRQRKSDVAVIMLSALGETGHKVTGLDAGADDYLAKPFKVPELLARIRALGRREGKVIKDSVVRFGDIELDSDSYEMRSGEKEFKLTAKEFALMDILLKSADKVVNKELILGKIWGEDAFKEDGYVEVYVSFLRKKLAELDSDVKITTMRGVGYKLEKK